MTQSRNNTVFLWQPLVLKMWSVHGNQLLLVWGHFNSSRFNSHFRNYFSPLRHLTTYLFLYRLASQRFYIWDKIYRYFQIRRQLRLSYVQSPSSLFPLWQSHVCYFLLRHHCCYCRSAFCICMCIYQWQRYVFHGWSLRFGFRYGTYV